MTNLADRFTKSPAGNLSPNPQTILVLPPNKPLKLLWNAARDLGEVRLVGNGVTVESLWPRWLHGSRGVLLTELGAYRDRSVLASQSNVRLDADKWLDWLLRDLTSIERPHRSFHNAATGRLLRDVLDARPYVDAMAKAFSGLDVRFVADCELARMLRSAGMRVKIDGEQRSLGLGRPAFVAASVGMAIVTSADLVRTFVRARRSLRAIEDRRSTGTTDWLALIPTWPRFNAHLQSAVGTGLDSDPRGAILVGDLRTGQRDEANLRAVTGNALWPGLGSGIEHVEQVVTEETPSALAAAIARGIARAARVAGRIWASREPVLDGYRVPIFRRPIQLAKFAIVDVMRATMYETAARSMIARRSVSGVLVTFATTAAIESAVPCIVLADAGAKTVEYAHGAVNEQRDGDTWARSVADVRIVWSQADAETVAPLGQRTVVAHRPARVEYVIRRRQRRVLIASNYAHRDSANGNFDPFETFQICLLGLAHHLPGFELRWRPHPADRAVSIARMRKMFAGLEVSRRPLSDDFAWASVVASSTSSLVFEAMEVGLPVFLHDRPDLVDSPATSIVPRGRRFFYPQDGALRIKAHFEALSPKMTKSHQLR